MMFLVSTLTAGVTIPGRAPVPKAVLAQQGLPRGRAEANVPFCIGVAGATASGKSSVVAKVVERVASDSVVAITQVSTHPGERLTHAKRSKAPRASFARATPSGLLLPRPAGRGARACVCVQLQLRPPERVRFRAPDSGDGAAARGHGRAGRDPVVRFQHALAAGGGARSAHHVAADRDLRGHPRPPRRAPPFALRHEGARRATARRSSLRSSAADAAPHAQAPPLRAAAAPCRRRTVPHCAATGTAHTRFLPFAAPCAAGPSPLTGPTRAALTAAVLTTARAPRPASDLC
eukprot:6555049-Prymnesium_polylepis.1